MSLTHLLIAKIWKNGSSKTQRSQKMWHGLLQTQNLARNANNQLRKTMVATICTAQSVIMTSVGCVLAIGKTTDHLQVDTTSVINMKALKQRGRKVNLCKKKRRLKKLLLSSKDTCFISKDTITIKSPKKLAETSKQSLELKFKPSTMRKTTLLMSLNSFLTQSLRS